MIEESRRRLAQVPADDDTLWGAWRLLRPGKDVPRDPFDGRRYGYFVDDDRYVIWSSGPDGEGGTEDDISVEGKIRVARGTERD